jgi:hypothetical protein
MKHWPTGPQWIADIYVAPRSSLMPRNSNTHYDISPYALPIPQQ